MGAYQTTVKILSAQAAITIAIALLAFLIADSKSGYSALTGGGINILATAVFALRVFSVQRDASAKRMARAFYWGEVSKFVVTIALFLVVLGWMDVIFLPLFLTYAATMLAFWIVLLIVT